MSAVTETSAALDAGIRIADPVVLEDGLVYAFREAGGTVEVVDRRDAAPFKQGTVQVYDTAAFLAYLNKHAAGSCEVWSDVEARNLVAVLDAHAAGVAGTARQVHRLQLLLRPTPAWQAWQARDGRFLSQTEFAEHIEANAPDVISPTGAEMLELAESFQATAKVDFESTEVRAGGKRALVYKETVSAKAGQRGQLEIPAAIDLAIRPFYGCEPYRVKARFRFRLDAGVLRLSYALDRPVDVLDAAYADLVGEVQGAATVPVWSGKAPH